MKRRLEETKQEMEQETKEMKQETKEKNMSRHDWKKKYQRLLKITEEQKKAIASTASTASSESQENKNIVSPYHTDLNQNNEFRPLRFKCAVGGVFQTFRQVLTMMSTKPLKFVKFLKKTFEKVTHNNNSFIFECIGIKSSELDTLFEFALIETPSLNSFVTNRFCLSNYNDKEPGDLLVYGTDNSVIVAPRGRFPMRHLEDFILNAEEEELTSFFKMIAKRFFENLRYFPKETIYLSTRPILSEPKWCQVRLETNADHYICDEFKNKGTM